MAIKKKIQSIFKQEDGSIVLEATLILPFIIIFILVLTSFVRISIVEMELENAGSETVKQVAHHIYPVIILYNELKEQNVDSNDVPLLDSLSSKNNIDGSLSEFVHKIDVFSAAAFEGKEFLLKALLQPILDANTNDKLIDFKDYQLVNVKLPAALGGTGDNFAIELRYDQTLRIPFINQKITIIKGFEERIWYDSSVVFENDKDQGEGSVDAEEDDEAEQYLRIHSISSPTQRGHKVKILIEGTPNEEVRIKLTYKSGFIKEVRGRLDKKGNLAKSIIIGGNSNEGVYVATVYLADLAASIEFEVLSKANMDKYILERKRKAGK